MSETRQNLSSWYEMVMGGNLCNIYTSNSSKPLPYKTSWGNQGPSYVLVMLLLPVYHPSRWAVSCSPGYMAHLHIRLTVQTWHVLVCLFPLGAVPRQVHRHWILPALLQAYSEQTSGPQGPGVHRPRVLQLPHLDQVCWLGSSIHGESDFEAACRERSYLIGCTTSEERFRQ